MLAGNLRKLLKVLQALRGIAFERRAGLTRLNTYRLASALDRISTSYEGGAAEHHDSDEFWDEIST